MYMEYTLKEWDAASRQKQEEEKQIVLNKKWAQGILDETVTLHYDEIANLAYPQRTGEVSDPDAPVISLEEFRRLSGKVYNGGNIQGILDAWDELILKL